MLLGHHRAIHNYLILRTFFDKNTNAHQAKRPLKITIIRTFIFTVFFFLARLSWRPQSQIQSLTLDYEITFSDMSSLHERRSFIIMSNETNAFEIQFYVHKEHYYYHHHHHHRHSQQQISQTKSKSTSEKKKILQRNEAPYVTRCTH